MDTTANRETTEVMRVLNDCIGKRMWGAVEVRLEAGRITLVRKIENLKVGGNHWNSHGKDLGDEHGRRECQAKRAG